MNGKESVRLLLTAGGLLLSSGCVFAFLHQWLYTVLIGIGALGCLAAALHFKNLNQE